MLRLDLIGVTANGPAQSIPTFEKAFDGTTREAGRFPISCSNLLTLNL